MPTPPDGHLDPARPVRRTESDSGLGIESARAPAGVRRFSHEAMATVFEVYAVHPGEQYAAQAAHAAFELVDRLEGELSRFVPNSDIARINQLAAGESVRVSPSTLECLLIARHVFNLTSGAFDVSMGTGLPLLDFDLDEAIVRASEAGVRLDLGGIGKGYAVDLMAEVLEEWNLGTALVHGGFSSVLALQSPAGGQGWPVTLSDPADPTRVLARLSVCHTALGASGLRKGNHIIEPRSGEVVRGRLAAWVSVARPEVAHEAATDVPREAAADVPRVAAAAVADALTTAFMVLSAADIEALCRRVPEIEAWVLPTPATGSPLLHFGGSSG